MNRRQYWTYINERLRMNEFYVYMYLREDGTPYYVGKGKDKRAFSGSRNLNKPSEDRIVFPYTNLTEEESFQKEIELIAKYGRKDIGTGILRNLTDGGEGASGAKRTPEQVERLRLSLMGKKRTAEQKLRMKQACQMTPERRQKLIEAAKKMSPESREARRQGFINMPEETRTRMIEKLRQANLGKKASAETKAKMSLASKKSMTPERIEKMKLIGQKCMTPEKIEKMRQINLGRKHTDETRKKISERQIGRKQSPEHVEKNRQKTLGRKHSAETKAKMSQAHKKRLSESAKKEITPETRAKIRQAHLGRKHSLKSIENMKLAQRLPETIEKKSKALKGKKLSSETRAKMSLAQRKRWNKQSTGLDNFLSD